MAHSMILGITESGKTSLAKQLARVYKAHGFGILVLDRMRDPGWNADYITDDGEEFLDVFWRSKKCMVFIDEGASAVGRYDEPMQRVVTQGRHWGHSVHIVSQGAVQLAPIVRDQCSHLFCFNIAHRSAKSLAEEFNQEELLMCAKLPQYHYVHSSRFGLIEFFNEKGAKYNVANRANSAGDNRRGLSGSGGVPGQKEASSEAAGGSPADQTGSETTGSGTESLNGGSSVGSGNPAE